MKKGLIIFIFLLGSGSVSILADEPVMPLSERLVAAGKTPRSKQMDGADVLVDTSLSATKARLHDLERRVASLEQENRFQEDRIRNLDRSIEDLKRRHSR